MLQLPAIPGHPGKLLVAFDWVDVALDWVDVALGWVDVALGWVDVALDPYQCGT
jgi:hypothetical protein